MSALLRTELLAEVLSRVAGELLIALGWRGTAVLVLAAVVVRACRGPQQEAAATAPRGVDVACVATVLLALLLIDG
ncbi:hypothetical protein E4198_14245 [Streptomyces sp. RKND-216]|uniref:hypothetical protein n=1 Tax=Streptomyces sp. RKND-216 TaxID=2562581 RepID=UPI00109D9FDB|nr:hypothetical protein [Streptomyces sp. RKND-216]THA25701.1 hypothetical protein E4198_14245 [Streptomyces sp. RKND-216]